MVGSYLSYRGAASANALNRQLARENREFQERAYKHRYQWTMADMRAAGLNPMLAATAGVSGSFPTGTVIPMQNVFGHAGDSIGDAVSSAVDVFRAETEGRVRGAQVERLGADLTKIAVEVDQIKASTELTREQKDNAIAERQRIWADMFLKHAQVDLNEHQRSLIQSEIAINKWSEIVERLSAEMMESALPRRLAEEDLYETAYGRFLHWLERSKDAINPFGGSGVGAPVLRGRRK